MANKILIHITDQAGRVDAVLSKENLSYSRTTLSNWLVDGTILVNNHKVKRSYKVVSGDTISITPPETQETKIEAENIPLDIIYEDDDIIVVNKPQGMVVHPGIPGSCCRRISPDFIGHWYRCQNSEFTSCLYCDGCSAL